VKGRHEGTRTSNCTAMTRDFAPSPPRLHPMMGAMSATLPSTLRAALPSRPQRTPPRPWARWFARSAPRALTAVMLGENCQLVRLEAAASGRLQLTAAEEGPVTELKRWQPLFARSQALLVLRSEERQLLTLDKPEVPDAELAMAVRWPLGEALDTEADQLLCSALPLPRINDTLRPQVLAVASRVDLARAHLATLAAAGIDVTSIDVSDSALRGMVLLQPARDDGCVVLAFAGAGISIGLLWRGQFCALRTLALPVRQPRDEAEFEEHLALHIQRTADHFERQATQLSVRRVLALMPSLPASARASVAAALPLAATMFDLGSAVEMSDAVRERCANHNDLSALACVAAARLIDQGLARQPAAPTPAAGATAEATR